MNLSEIARVAEYVFECECNMMDVQTILEQLRCSSSHGAIMLRCISISSAYRRQPESISGGKPVIKSENRSGAN